MLEIIFELEERARALATWLGEAEQRIQEHSVATPEAVEHFGGLLASLCENLDAIDRALKSQDSPLITLHDRLGPTESLLGPEGIELFLRDHKLLLARIGMDSKMIEAAISLLQDQSILSESTALTPESVTEAIGSFKSTVCEISRRADAIQAAIQGEQIRTITDGAMGVCIVVVDVTGAFTTPDPTAFTQIKAMKSTIIGAKKVMYSGRAIRNWWVAFRRETAIRRGR